MYQKDGSLQEIRQHSRPGNVLARVESVLHSLADCPLTEYQKGIVRSACEELLGLAKVYSDNPPFSLQTHVIEEIRRLADSQLPRYLFYRYRYVTFPQRRILDDFPPCLQIESASVCNYRCTFCYQGDQDFTKASNGHMGMMSLEVFKGLIDQAEGRCEAITLASRGEPLLCPQIEDMLQYASGKFLALKLNTNGWFLDERKCHALLQADANTVVFSVDAASEPTYSRLRVGGSLERVEQNIRRFHDIRAKHYPNSRTITRVAGVRVPGTPDLNQMVRFWGDVVDQVVFVRYNPWENTYQRPVNDIAAPCSDLWRRMFVWWDGTVNPCDVDYKSMLAVGTSVGHPLGELWRSEAYAQLREKHVARQRTQCSPCNRCTFV